MDLSRGLDTPGRSSLCDWLKEPKNTQSMLAKTLGLGQSSVSLWVHGRSRPEPHLREALEAITGISPSAWHTDDERALVERVRVAAETGQLADASPAPATIPPPTRRASPRQRAAKARERRRAA